MKKSVGVVLFSAALFCVALAGQSAERGSLKASQLSGVFGGSCLQYDNHRKRYCSTECGFTDYKLTIVNSPNGYKPKAAVQCDNVYQCTGMMSLTTENCGGG